MRILVADDEPEMTMVLEALLKREHYSVDVVYNGQDALDYGLAENYDCIVLDIMMPKLDGIQALQTLRSKNISTPVLLLTAKSQVEDRVAGLDSGADDYLPKPFATEELLARIRALSRRPVQWESTQRLTRGDLELDTELCALRGPRGSCSLSKRETQLFLLFLRNLGQVMTRELLLARVWGPDAPVEEGNLDNYIHFLRRRLGAVGSGMRLTTLRGVGYRLEEQP